MPFPFLAPTATSRRRRPARPPASRALAGRTDRLAAGLLAGLLAGMTAICLLPAAASAQFATGLTPPPRPAAAAEVAAAESVVVAARDSVVREQRLDMKAWVDSAASSLQAGATVATPLPVSPDDTTSRLPPVSPIPPARDSAAAPAPRPASPSPAVPAPVPARRPPASPGFRPGAPAPDTATPLPLLALVGAGLLGSGLTMLRRKG